MGSSNNCIVEKRSGETTIFRIVPVRSEEDIEATKALFYEYTAWLNIDLNYQSFGAEMATFPGKYAPPTGELFLARTGQGDPIGCAALRPLDKSVCEMKRLFVKDSAKGLGVGKALVLALIDAAKKLGYDYMRLDSLPKMTAALGMYRSLGFANIQPYYETPMPETIFLELDMRPQLS